MQESCDGLVDLAVARDLAAFLHILQGFLSRRFLMYKKCQNLAGNLARKQLLLCKKMWELGKDELAWLRHNLTQTIKIMWSDITIIEKKG